jgi:hypothetical protein
LSSPHSLICFGRKIWHRMMSRGQLGRLFFLSLVSSHDPFSYQLSSFL